MAQRHTRVRRTAISPIDAEIAKRAIYGRKLISVRLLTAFSIRSGVLALLRSSTVHRYACGCSAMGGTAALAEVEFYHFRSDNIW
jgi:hypothetical protein